MSLKEVKLGSVGILVLIFGLEVVNQLDKVDQVEWVSACVSANLVYYLKYSQTKEVYLLFNSREIFFCTCILESIVHDFPGFIVQLLAVGFNCI